MVSVSLQQARVLGSRLVLSALMAWGMAGAASAQEVLSPNSGIVVGLKQKLTQRLAEMPPIESVRTTPVPGVYEVQAGTQIFYSDAKGEYLIEGNLVETRSQRNLTGERMDEINKIDFTTLPIKDAVVWKNGNGKRKLVVFADPNCGYCKHLEKDIQQLKDVTVYTFMIGILGEDSKVKLDNIWCVKDKTQAWRDWMLAGQVPAKAFGMCASPGKRNGELAQKLRVNGTPAMFFEDGSRLASAAPADVVEKRLVKASGKAGS